jgi:hypothetical protein
LHRPRDQRAREGQATFILGVALGARQTREGVHSIVHGPAHPVDGSQPRNWARMIFPHGESSGALAQVCPSARMHMPMPAARCPWCSLCLPPISGRHLRAIWSHKDLLGGPGAARCEDADGPCMHACCVRAAMRECTDCDPTGVRVAFARMIFRGPHVRRTRVHFGPI